MALWIMTPSNIAVADELRRLIRRIAGVFQERERAKQRARFWSDVREGEREATASAGNPVGPALEKTLRHRRRSRKA
jgi:hypothetical protein